jgi:hypothetical protein
VDRLKAEGKKKRRVRAGERLWATRETVQAFSFSLQSKTLQPVIFLERYE